MQLAFLGESATRISNAGEIPIGTTERTKYKMANTRHLASRRPRPGPTRSGSWRSSRPPQRRRRRRPPWSGRTDPPGRRPDPPAPCPASPASRSVTSDLAWRPCRSRRRRGHPGEERRVWSNISIIIKNSSILTPPEGRPGISDVSLPVWSLRAFSLIPLSYIYLLFCSSA